MKANPKLHKLNIGETQIIQVKASADYSNDQITVSDGEAYKVWCNKGNWWVDMIIPAGADGYPNPLANLFGQRVKGARCFCLCGTYNNNDAAAFAIGRQHEFDIKQNAVLSFFANDVKGYEWNNWGSIVVMVKRLS